MELIKTELGDLLYFFGYTNLDEHSLTNFFTFEQHTEEHKKLYNGFMKVNEDSMKEVLHQPR